MDTIVKFENITKQYEDKIIFKELCLEVEKNEYIVIVGKSGSGKSTLLNMIGLLDKQDSGNIYLMNYKNIKPYSRKAEKLLKNNIGYLFQNFALIDDETVYDNLKFVVGSSDKKYIKDKVLEVLKEVGLEGYEDKKIYKCSGGEQQRIAIARLLLKKCDLVLADEPTGSLDDDNKLSICKLLLRLHQQGKTIVVVTHDLALTQYASRIVNLDDLIK